MKILQEGDRCLIIFEGRMGGTSFEDSTPFDGGRAVTPYPIIIGKNEFVGPAIDKDTAMQYEGFEQQLIGMVYGETKIVTVLFPETYPEHLRGKVAFFKVEIVGV